LLLETEEGNGAAHALSAAVRRGCAQRRGSGNVRICVERTWEAAVGAIPQGRFPLILVNTRPDEQGRSAELESAHALAGRSGRILVKDYDACALVRRCTDQFLAEKGLEAQYCPVLGGGVLIAVSPDASTERRALLEEWQDARSEDKVIIL